MNIGVDIDDTISNSFEIIFGDSQIFDIEEMNGTGKVKNIGNKEVFILFNANEIG